MEIPKEIQDAIKQNKLVIFVGAGLSIKFNLPTWKKLVTDVINETNKNEYKAYLPLLELGEVGMSPIEVIEKLKNEHTIISKYIKSNFKIEKGDFLLHKKIFDLTGQIITTNYDNAFELASNNCVIPATYTSEFNISEIGKNNEPYIFKLHGSYTESDKCIIYRHQYDTLYSGEMAAIEKLKSIFIEKTILFLGFSFQDPDISMIFNNLDRIFGNNNKHFILTKESNQFKKHSFLKPIEITGYNQIEPFIDDCLNFKLSTRVLSPVKEEMKEPELNSKVKVAFLTPKTLDVIFSEEMYNVSNYFDTIDATVFKGALNKKTLLKIEEFDLLIIVSKVFKSQLYIEDDNLKSDLISIEEILDNIPNDKIPTIFISNEKIQPVNKHPSIYISSYKNAIISRFIYKAFKCNDLEFREKEVTVNLDKKSISHIKKGKSLITSIYGNNKNLDIGKKSLTNIIGRVEEQSIIASKLINIIKTNKILNIKASGGTGKTTLIKKVSYELYERGYFKDGVNFKSCESIKTYADFEEIIIEGFNLNNILNFKDYLFENYHDNKMDSLIILDNFETVVNSLNKLDFLKVIDLLKFASDFNNIVITSREKIGSIDDDFEDVYSLTPMITDDALVLFQKYYGEVKGDGEIRILRNEILEDLLNNNPLAIKLVTKSRTRFKHIIELKEQLSKYFFESTNEDFSNVFKNNADLNIERTRSIYQSINYSYLTLSSREKIAFELLSLFPDGMSLSNFKKCFEQKSSSSNQISDKDLRVLKDKSLIEDYNGILQLQPIIRRFAEFQFMKRPKEAKQKYCLDAYLYNCFILEIIQFIGDKKSKSEALKLFMNFKNNILNVLNYMVDIELDENGPVPEKKYLLSFISLMEEYILNQKQINEFEERLLQLKDFFKNISHAETFIDVLINKNTYYYEEFDFSYNLLCKYLTVEEMENRELESEDYIEKRYKNIISHILSMEGFTLQRFKFCIKNNETTHFLDANLFYLGIPSNLCRKRDGFYFFEYEHMFGRLDIKLLQSYISNLYLEEHLEILQCTYLLSKVMKVEKTKIQKLVVTNPYTKGLKELMFAFSEEDENNKIKYFESALKNLFHIKYFYIEALYYYCLFLNNINSIDYKIKLDEGLLLSRNHKYQYLNYLFESIIDNKNVEYCFNYEYYKCPGLEEFVELHNNKWESVLKNEI